MLTTWLCYTVYSHIPHSYVTLNTQILNPQKGLAGLTEQKNNKGQISQSKIYFPPSYNMTFKFPICII